MRLFVGADAHVSIFAALRYLGFGERVSRVASDAEGRMDAQALATALDTPVRQSLLRRRVRTPAR